MVINHLLPGMILQVEAQAFDGVPIHWYGTLGGISAPSGHLAPGKKHISIPSLDKKSVIIMSLHVITSCVQSVKNPVRPGLNTATCTLFPGVFLIGNMFMNSALVW